MYEPTFDDRISGSAALRRRQAVVRGLARVAARLDVQGLERIPDSGGIVLAVNHRAFLDGPVLFGLVDRPISFLVKNQAFTPTMAPMLRTTGQVPVVRERPDVAAVRFSLQILRAGGVIGLFPEGTRGDGLVRTAKPGVGYFALRTGAVVVPVACHGTEGLLRGPHRPVIRVTVGEPIDLGHVPWGQRVSRRAVLDATEQVRATLARLVVVSSPVRPLRAAA